MTPRLWTRRRWLTQTLASGVALAACPLPARSRGPRRTFNACLSAAILEEQPELLATVREAGVGTVWVAGFFYGYRPYPDEQLLRVRTLVEKAGMEAHLVNIPLGHPGDSLGSSDGNFPLTPPKHWHLGFKPDGKTYAGTSLHRPATEENVAALKHYRQLNFHRCFVDDDFRLARGPGEIGGCFCPEHREKFLRAGGYPDSRWEELLEDVRARRLSPLLRAWLNLHCDELTASFRAQTAAFGGPFGIMVMYLGSEKAGIRLADYRHAPFRVGELMFDDGSFRPVKGKTDELFSALFHRRYARPENAYSETTAYPANKLSAPNMAAKLVISTIADVRQTMFMSGLTPFPKEHWGVLGPAMRVQTRLHEELAGHVPHGPFKHFWGEAQRWVGNDRPFSLWLALGVPFEVTERLPDQGWVFLSDHDARAMADQPPKTQARLVCRNSGSTPLPGAESVAEKLPELFAFKRSLEPALKNVPHLLEEEPAVCAWYPTARKVLVWNLSEEPKTLTLAWRSHWQSVRLSALEATTIALPRTATL